MESLSINNYLKIFLQFPEKDRVKIAEKINQLTFADRWQEMDAYLPDVGLSEDEIMKEVTAVRYAAKK